VPGYTLVRKLGHGAMGVVWLAETDDAFEREKALKFIDITERFGHKEYRALKTVKTRGLMHGNLLKLINYWLKDSEGKIIPRAEEPDSSKRPFHSPQPSELRSSDLSAATPQSMGTTDTPAGTSEAPPAVAAAAQHAIGKTTLTVVAKGTLRDIPGAQPISEVGAAQNFAGSPQSPQRQAVQLIVAMEKGDKSLEDRKNECCDDQLPGVPVDELLTYMEQAARGLDYLHREAIIHRDVKPANIMLVGSVAKICDYGLVVTTDVDLSTTTNAFTPLYASPEAVRGQPVSPQSDQYSLAVTYCELRTGKTPYPNGSPSLVYTAKETGKYDLSLIRKGPVRAVLQRALAKPPSDRFSTCTEFVHELEAAERRTTGKFWALATVVVLAAGIGISLSNATTRNWWRDHILTRVIAIGGDEAPPPVDPKEPAIDKVPEPVVVTLPDVLNIAEEARPQQNSERFVEAAERLAQLSGKISENEANRRRFDLESNRRAIATLAAQLRKEQLFRDDGLANQAVDHGILQNLVAPALLIPRPDAMRSEEKRDWAVILAATARLLERCEVTGVTTLNEALRAQFSAATSESRPIPPLFSEERHTDPYVNTLLIAKELYSQAQQLDEQPLYAAGLGRTVIKLPRGELDEGGQLSVLEDLIQRYDPAGKSTNPSLLLIGGWVLKRQALNSTHRSEQLRLVKQALDRFRSLDQATTDADPYGIRSLALCNASEANLRAAFWTEIQSSDEPGSKDENTKYFLLQRALARARAAQSERNRRLPEAALIAEGNALEDLAYYYKDTSQYEAAAKAFQSAIGVVGHRSQVQARLSLGRCQYRWGVDAWDFDLNQQQRADQFQASYQVLRIALQQTRSDQWEFLAETNSWLGYLLKDSVWNGPGNLDANAAAAPRPEFLNASFPQLTQSRSDAARKRAVQEELAARVEPLELAWKHLGTAAETAKARSKSTWPEFLVDSADAGSKLALLLSPRALGADAPAEPKRETVVQAVARQAQQLLESAQRDPASVPPNRASQALNLLLSNSQDRVPGDVIRDWLPIFNRQSEDWQTENVTLLLRLAQIERDSPKAAAAVTAAKEIAAQKLREPALSLAMGNCLRVEASVLLRPYQPSPSPFAFRSKRGGEFTLAEDSELKQIEDLYYEAYRQLTKTFDRRSMEMLDRFIAEPLENIERGKGVSSLSKFERHWLRSKVQLTQSVRSPLALVLDARLKLHRDDWKLADPNAPLPSAALSVALRTMICVKLSKFLNVNTSLDREVVLALEKKLAK
jgi:serine/threonine protein kinase